MTDTTRVPPATSALHYLPARRESVHWGFFDRERPPLLQVRSGDLVAVETITHRAGDAPELLMDDVVAAIYDEVQERGPGGHILTGPIAVEGAQPGDALEVRILQLTPRLPFGSNRASPAGYLYRELGSREQVTIYAVDAQAGLAIPRLRYTVPTDALGIGRRIEARARDDQPFSRQAAVPLRPHLGIAGVAPAEHGRVSSVPPGR